MDFIEGLLKSVGKDIIFVILDRFSKNAHFLYLAHLFNVVQIAKIFMKNVYKLHGLPQSIVSDIVTDIKSF